MLSTVCILLCSRALVASRAIDGGAEELQNGLRHAGGRVGLADQPSDMVLYAVLEAINIVDNGGCALAARPR